MAKKDALGDRMKTYEQAARGYLTRRMPVIIRADGAHFHSFTRNFEKPFDEILTKAMMITMARLCKNVQNCVLGYTQSDEITLVLCDYKKLETNAWFDNQVQKICSTSAALATLYFNQALAELLKTTTNYELNYKMQDYLRALEQGATFDARCFNLPKEEVCNCLIWRQQDAIRNSIQMLAQSLFPHKELQGKSCKDLLVKMLVEKGINWHDISPRYQRGSCAIKQDYIKFVNGSEMTSGSKWIVDTNIPIFTENREYIEERINFGTGGLIVYKDEE